jgi:hypothetical protein
MRPTFLVVLALLTSPCAYAIADITLAWQGLEVRVSDYGYNPTVAVGLESGEPHHGYLKQLLLRWGGRRAAVPKEELRGIPQVRLRSLTVVRPDVLYEGGPTLRVEFRLAPGAESEPNGIVRFEFEGGVYKRRSFEYEWKSGQWVSETKEVGKRSERRE